MHPHVRLQRQLMALCKWMEWIQCFQLLGVRMDNPGRSKRRASDAPWLDGIALAEAAKHECKSHYTTCVTRRLHGLHVLVLEASRRGFCIQRH